MFLWKLSLADIMTFLGKQNIWSNYRDLTPFFTPKVAEEGKSPSQDYPCWRNIIIWPDSRHDMNLSKVHISQNASCIPNIYLHLASNLWGKFVGKSSISHGAYGPTDGIHHLLHGPRECASAPVAGPDPSPGTQRSSRLHPGYWKTSRSIPI